jgi:hypothetical protein
MFFPISTLNDTAITEELSGYENRFGWAGDSEIAAP